MAFGSQTFTDLGGAVSDIFGSQNTAAGLRIKAQGDIAEGQSYDLASQLATQNEKFTEASTAIKLMQQERETNQVLGEQRADVASSGFEEGGSALDLLRDSASQGKLQQQVLGQQGLITEAGYQEQAQSFNIMSAAAKTAASEEQDIADKTETLGYITGGLKAVAAVATLFTGDGGLPIPGAGGGGKGGG